jgi:hypothetical protein
LPAKKQFTPGSDSSDPIHLILIVVLDFSQQMGRARLAQAFTSMVHPLSPLRVFAFGEGAALLRSHPMKPSNCAAIVFIVACAIVVAFLMRAREDLAVARAQIAALQAANADLTQRIADLENSHIDDAMLKRLQSDQREAIKLRAEVAKLKQSVAVAEAAAAAAKSSATSATNPPVDAASNPYARVIGRKLIANVNLGHAVVFGGWQSVPGKQAFALAVPKLVPGTSDQLAVETRWFEISDEAMSKFDTAMLLRASGQQATLTPEQLESLVNVAKDTTGVDLLSAPNVSVPSGRPARISVTETRNTPNGPVEFGPVMDVTPTLAADGTSVNLVLDAKLTFATEPPAEKQ